MGFDEYISRESFPEDTDGITNYYSDLGDYKKIIELFENNNGMPLFIHNVTVQNHGGYLGVESLKDPSQAVAEDSQYPYDDVREYETLIKQSDSALEYLINYFKSVEQPVIICFYGDHQPSLDKTFQQTLINTSTDGETPLSLNQRYYTAPYFIWANYETNNKNTSNVFEKNGIDVISPNYLASSVMKYAGLKMSDFNNYLLQLRYNIPAMNAFGYLGTDSIWHTYDDKNTDVLNYSIVQYNGMHDKDRNNNALFKISADLTPEYQILYSRNDIHHYHIGKR